MNDILQMKNNLIQNFYVIGLPFEEIINLSTLENKQKSFDIFIEPSRVYSPKIISKFPPTDNNFNKILDEFVINHCFPDDLIIKEGKNYNNYKKIFVFELDNKLFKYIDKDKFLYSKIHFTCLKFYEPIKDYKKLKDFIYNKLKGKDKEKEDEISDLNIKNVGKPNIINDYIKNEIVEGISKPYYIPKVICFASLLPFPGELSNILVNIYEFYKYQVANFNKSNFNFYPIEKLIEQIVMSLPLPISNKSNIILSFNIDKNNDNLEINKNIFPNPNVIFSSYDLKDYYLNKSHNLSMIELFNYFSEENIIKIFKYIILENPILFFCEDKEILSNIIEGFLNILSPFKYVLPCITILPSKYYGLIHSQDKFLFGINQKYAENFFVKNEINLNKNIIIVSINTLNMNLSKIEEASKKNENDKIKNIYINQEDSDTNFPNTLIDIDLPAKPKKKLLTKLKMYITNIRNDFKRKKIENTFIFNGKVRHIFHKFFKNILSGYTQYLLRCPDHRLYGDNIRHKYNGKNGLIKYIKEIFDIDKFISNYPKETQMFYKSFFNTELFFNFIRGIIYPNNEIESLKHIFFDFMTFLKKHKELRKEEDFKEQYEKYKKPNEPKKNKINKSIFISNKYYFIDEEKKILMDKEKQKTALLKYGQLIELKKKENEDQKNITEIIFSIRYFIFPKLLFDNEFFKDYNSQFYRHYIELPDNSIIQDLNKALIISEKDYISKYCVTIYPKLSSQKNSISNFFFNQNKNTNHSISNQNIIFDLYIHNYIEFNWLLLLSCSLWYCNSNKEKEMRINKIFSILEKLDFIEEQVLYFIFISLYKYSNIGQFIRIFEFLYRFVGSYEYSDNLFLFKKLSEFKKNENVLEKINNDIDNKINIQKRSFFDVKKYLSSEEIDDKLKEEIIFNSEQICEKCGKNINLSIPEISDIINRKIDKKKNSFIYKCKACGELNYDIIIKYNILLSNIKKNKEKKMSEGKFNLIMPHLLYQEIKNYVIGLKDNNIDINHIFSNKNINLLNFIFFFTLNCLPFDFLIPYENSEDNKIDREYFNDNDYTNIEEINKEDSQSKLKFLGLSSINSDNLSL